MMFLDVCSVMEEKLFGGRGVSLIPDRASPVLSAGSQCDLRELKAGEGEDLIFTAEHWSCWRKETVGGLLCGHGVSCESGWNWDGCVKNEKREVPNRFWM